MLYQMGTIGNTDHNNNNKKYVISIDIFFI